MNEPDPPIIHAPLLDRLLRTAEPASVSALAQHLNLTEKKTLREIDRLCAAGCEIHRHPQRGLTLVHSGLGAWRDYLAWACPRPTVRTIEVYRNTTSTQDAARRLIDTDHCAADGAIAIADEQTAGRGRLGRRWVAPPGTAVTFSRVYVSSGNPISVDQLTLISAVAVARAIESACGLAHQTISIKWPNDLIARGGKLAGILVETYPLSANARAAAAVIGVGINAASSPDELTPAPPGRGYPTTSLAAIGSRVDRLWVLTEVIRQLDVALASPTPRALLAEWRERCPMLSEPVRLRQNGQLIEGTVIDLHPTDGLIVRTDAGMLLHLPAASTTVVRTPPASATP